MRVVIAAVVGAVIYFIWQMLTWMMLPIHGPTVSALPDEKAVTSALVDQQLESGVYIAPYGEGEDAMQPGSEFMKLHETGPIYAVYFHKEGLPVMGPRTLAGGFIIDLVAALIVACMLSCAAKSCCRAYLQKVAYVVGFGVFLAVAGHMSYWNWMNFALDYTLAFVVDNVVGWALVGLAMAAIIPSSKEAG